ncbi:hypothetical protein Acr_07g0002600 [Actinidia rufa]|uniref:EVE domain-containing protein n=1 Tax=Actinidia rufa TaxID=165716 RepID=A0A7J0EUH3_9ERIC|nr:hypothetical protein Acr_07g0002600 [Actinidia rufa]
MGREKHYWLLKTEAGEWSWEDQAANGGLSNWDGARRVVGVVSVVREWYSDGEDDGGLVDVKAVGEMRRPVDLKEMKEDVGLKGFALFRQPRLSVVPVPEDVWNRVCDLGGGFGEDGRGSGSEDDV